MLTLRVDDVHLQYGAAKVLRGVSLAAAPARVTCVLGRNGVGKTSLTRAIAGHHPISAGAISIDGKTLGKSPPFARAGLGIGFVPQGREIFPLLTVRENLETGFARLPRDQRSIQETVFDLFPVLGEMLGRRGGDLSGGQQQQLAIGRALVMRPKVLVLDEPTEGIQPSIIKDIGRALRFLRDELGMAILLIEQYLDFCRELADDVYVMDRGQIVHGAPPEDLDDPEVRKLIMV